MERLKLPKSGQVYLDSNVVIYIVEKVVPYRALKEPLLAETQTGRLSVVTSELTLLEVMTKPFRQNNKRLEFVLRDFLNANEMALIPIDRSVLEAAARLRGSGLKTPDAIHAATGTACGCSLFLTNDAVFERVPGLPLAILHKVAAA